jgi:RNA polymerase sigma-70 factor (ECF subfamily)
MDSSALSVSDSLASTPQATLDYWVEQCLAGKESAYVEVYNQYAGIIYRLCFSLLRHKEDAEEVLQDTFEYAFRKLHNFDPDKASFKTWLYQIAVSRCRNKRRRKWLLTTPINALAREQVVDESAVSPDEAITFTERQLLVWNALGDLSTKLRETAILRYYDGLTYAQIGEVLKIPAKTAESRMRLAHKALKVQLIDDISSSSDI